MNEKVKEAIFWVAYLVAMLPPVAVVVWATWDLPVKEYLLTVLMGWLIVGIFIMINRIFVLTTKEDSSNRR